MNDEPWYGAKCVFRHDDLQREEGSYVYEERVVLIRADSFDEAIAKAEQEAHTYAEEFDGIYLDFCGVYHLADNEVGDGCEVYSLMRTSDLEVDDFITRYFDDGTQHEGATGEPGAN